MIREKPVACAEFVPSATLTQAGAPAHECLRTLIVNGVEYNYYSVNAVAALAGDIANLPRSLKVVTENLLRFADKSQNAMQVIRAMCDRVAVDRAELAIEFRPSRVLSQDFAGVPMIVDLACLREAAVRLGIDPARVNPVIPVDLVVDHSVAVDHYGAPDSLARNMSLEIERNRERFEFLQWARNTFTNFTLVPPGKGICHQINLEYLARVVSCSRGDDGELLAYPDTVLGIDSHTTMINGLGVLGWGTGGIEVELAMLGEPVSILAPRVVGVRLTGALREGVTPTDLVLEVTAKLRAVGVVGKFVEFFGPGLAALSVADRATVSNMAPDYGATCAYFPIDRATLEYMQTTGRDEQHIELVREYAVAQGLWHEPGAQEPVFDDVIDFDLATVVTSLAGPKRPQDRVKLADVPASFQALLNGKTAVSDTPTEVADGDVVIASITSCTNTSNPYLMIAAGLLAKRAVQAGLAPKAHVKTSFAPGSQVVTDYLRASGLQEYLDRLGFNVVGYGCATCIGNSGPLAPEVLKVVDNQNVHTVAVLSGNRNFEGRIHSRVKASYIASPPMVVAYALCGSILADLAVEPLGRGTHGRPIYLRDLWPTSNEVNEHIARYVRTEYFEDRYLTIGQGEASWSALSAGNAQLFPWRGSSTYLANPPYFDAVAASPTDIVGARALLVVGDSVTTDHISPAGAIEPDSPAGKYLMAAGVPPDQLSTYGARRGHHEVMMRGTFSNPRIHNQLVAPLSGGITVHAPSGKIVSIYDAAMLYKKANTPLVVVGGREYGTGSSRDWASKGVQLLGVRAVIAESFERIHRSNLVGMGVLPLELLVPATRNALALRGDETFDIKGLDALRPREEIVITITRADHRILRVRARVRIDTDVELEYFRHGGVLPYFLRRKLLPSSLGKTGSTSVETCGAAQGPLR